MRVRVGASIFLEVVLRTRYHTQLDGLVGQIWIGVCERENKKGLNLKPDRQTELMNKEVVPVIKSGLVTFRLL